MKDSRLEPTEIPTGATEDWGKVAMKVVDPRGYDTDVRTEKVPFLNVTNYQC